MKRCSETLFNCKKAIYRQSLGYFSLEIAETWRFEHLPGVRNQAVPLHMDQCPLQRRLGPGMAASCDFAGRVGLGLAPCGLGLGRAAGRARIMEKMVMQRIYLRAWECHFKLP